MNKVVRCEFITSEIAKITMEDRENKNTFSPEMIGGLIDSFEQVSSSNDVKVVILTGYENYFSSGGTKQSLLDLQSGNGNFTDINLYSLAIDCPVPTISAMQGHGIGGGFVMGLFSDFVLLSKESVYTTNFMKYGFTPGMGATFIVPEKLGVPFGHEMLLNAQTYRGYQFLDRGVTLPVYPQADVLDKAIELAHQLAEKPSVSLRVLKQHLALPIKRKLQEVVEQEVVMHKMTFTSDEVKQKIETLF